MFLTTTVIVAEVAWIVPGHFQKWRTHKRYDAHQDIRRNLMLKQVTDDTPYEAYAVMFSVTQTGHCNIDGFCRDCKVCVICDKFVLRNRRKPRCPGHRNFLKETAWWMLNGCHGKWVNLAVVHHYACQHFNNTYIFI